MKRLLALLLCLVMIAALIPAAAAEDIELVDVDETEEDLDAPEEGEEIRIIDVDQEHGPLTLPNGSVEIDDTNFPDPTFRDYVRNSFDENDDSTLSASEIAAIVSMNCSCLDLNSLKGIGYFTALEYLDCSYNNLTALDLSQNTALKNLYCEANDLLSLNVSNNTSLTYLDCSSNPLTSLDVSNNKALVYLSCTWMELSSLDVSKNTKLEYLAARSNNLTSLDVTKNTKLKDLNCIENSIGTLNVSCCPDLLFLITNGKRHEYTDYGQASISYDYVYYMGEEGSKSHVLWFDWDTTLIYKPTITTQPASKTVTENETVKFTVKATGASSYQWQYRKGSTGTWYNSTGTGNKTATLTVTATAARNGFQFRCKVSNASGYVNSKIATLTVSKLPVITTQPTSKTVNDGENAKFTVAATGATSYQWQYRRGTEEWHNSTAASAKSKTLSLEATAARNGLQFRCKVSNANGTTISKVVTLTVVTSPSITTQPLSQVAAVGKTASFTVAAKGGALSYQWQYRKSETGVWNDSSSTGANTATLSVTATEARNGFQYRCKITNAKGSVISRAVTLTVVTKPAVATQPKDKTVAAGTQVKFYVQATGGRLSYQWQYRKNASDSWHNSSAETAHNAALTIEATTARDGFEYRCKITNAAGTTYSGAALLTVCTKPVITTQPTNKTATAGTTVKFKVTATGNGLKYQWQYRANSSDSWHNCTSTGNKTAEMTLTATAARNGFQYRCRITNAADTTYSKTVTLTVK